VGKQLVKLEQARTAQNLARPIDEGRESGKNRQREPMGQWHDHSLASRGRDRNTEAEIKTQNVE
jgi:hypothetical protein